MQDQSKRKKKAVNLSVDAGLLEEAKASGANLSGLLEDALRAKLKEQRWQKWREENRAAIEASNEELERNGMWYTPDWLNE